MKRILSMLLVLCMVLSFMPRFAAAQETDAAIAEPVIGASAATEESMTVDAPGDLARPEIPEEDTVTVDAVGNYTPNATLTFARWISTTEYGDAIDGSLYTGVRYYYNYQIYDSDTNTMLNDLVNANYTVYLAIYNPSGSVVYSHSFSKMDEGWISTSLPTAGQYRFYWSITGDITGSNSFYVNVVSSGTGTKEIHCDTTSMTLEDGETGTAYVWTTGTYSEATSILWGSSNESVADCRWGEWNDDGKCPLYIYANSPGSATITVSSIVTSTERVLDYTYIYVTVTEAGESYTISFDVTGGSGAPSSITATAGSTVTLPSTVPTANTFGNYFYCWETYDLGGYSTNLPGDQITVPENNVYYDAYWMEPEELDLYSLYTSGSTMTVNDYIYFPNQTVFYKFYPGGSSSNPITYQFEGVTTGDSQIYLYDASGSQIDWDDDDGDGNQFLLEHTFSDNNLYYIKVRMYSTGEGDLDFDITCLTEAAMYTVTYSDPLSIVNRTDGGPAGSTLTVPEDMIPDHIGKTFLGWGAEDSDEVILCPGDEFVITSDVTYYAKYQDPVVIPSTTTSVEQSVTPLFANGLYWFSYTPRVSTSYQFQDLDSGSDTYVVIYDIDEHLLAENDNNGNSNTFRAAAQMSSNATYLIGVATHSSPSTFNMLVDRGYRITYNANGGVNAPAQTYVYSEMGGTLSEDAPSRDGYRFLGWATSASATTAAYTAGQQVDFDTNTTLYAIWGTADTECTHNFGSWEVTTEPTCTEPGVETRTCTLCGETETRDVPALGHDYQDGECTRCHEEDPNPTPDGVIRLAGANRYATGFAVANQLKANLGVDRFQAAVVACGTNFPDALTGSYLASVKNAPLLLTDPKDTSVDQSVAEYLSNNLVSGGQIYILGGDAAVSPTFETVVKYMGFQVTRLKGAGRYETNLAILNEAGVNTTDEILIATGKNYADSLSASATGLPMLLVDKSLTASQKAFLAGTSKKFVILGGTGAVSAAVEAELDAIGDVVRVRGSNRYLTSIAIARKYFGQARTAVLAYAQGFPDGLCGGPLAMSMGAPLILTSNDSYDAADEYIQNVSSGAVTGGTGRISDSTVRDIFDLAPSTPIPKV